jgi:hypothetical protein
VSSSDTAGAELGAEQEEGAGGAALATLGSELGRELGLH